MKKLLFIAALLLSVTATYAMDLFNREPDVLKGEDYAFMQDNAKMWLYLDFTKAELVLFHNNKKQEVKESKGLYLATKTEEDWANEFEGVYFWIIKYWNVACDKRNIPLHLTADRDSAKYVLEFRVDTVDYGFPQVGLIMGEGATLDGPLVVRDLTTNETVYEADINKIKTENWAPHSEVMRLRATLYGAIFGPHFLGMDPITMDVSDKATLMRYNKDYKPKKKKK
ncbi:MAG: hypothetical protein IKX20_00565 [Paludibacteraceae bacterium]|nr:hypothetical protein [Paludibacteraceae bacterium]